MGRPRNGTDKLISESEALRAQLVSTALRLERFVAALQAELLLGDEAEQEPQSER